MCPLQDSALTTLIHWLTSTLHLLRVHLIFRLASAARDREQTLQSTARPSAASKYTVALVKCKFLFSLSLFGRSFQSLISPGLAEHLCAEDPALSTLSGGSSLPHEGFGTSSLASTSTPSSRDTKSPSENMESVEAHWQPRLRWVSTISFMLTLQAQKRKRKTVRNGVSASVRYRLSATLTDSKQRTASESCPRHGSSSNLRSLFPHNLYRQASCSRSR